MANRVMLRRLAYARWAAEDPKAALTHFLATSQRHEDHAVWAAVFQTWAMVNPVEAERAAQELVHVDDRNWALACVFGSWYAGNATAAHEEWDTYRMTTEGRSHWLAILALLAGMQPNTALALLDEADWSQATDAGVRNLFTALAVADPRSALERALALNSKNPVAAVAVAAVLKIYALLDQATALAAVGQLTEPTLRANAEAQVLTVMAARDPEGAYKLWKDIPLELRTLDTLQNIFSNWTQQDPVAASMEATQFLPVDMRRSIVETVAMNWVKTDPDASVAWVVAAFADSKSGLGPNGTDVVIKMGQYLADRDPEAALKIARQFGPRSAIPRYLYGAAGTAMAARDPSTALAWANNLLDDGGRAFAVNSVFTSMCAEDPLKAFDAIAKFPTVPSPENLVDILVNTWGKDDPVSAFAWAQSKLSGDLFQKTANKLLVDWAEYDPATVAAMAQKFIDDPKLAGLLTNFNSTQYGRQGAFADFNGAGYINLAGLIARRLAQQDPSAARTWTEGLPEGALQDAARSNAIYGAIAADPAKAWLDAESLPEGMMTNALRGDIINNLSPETASDLVFDLPEGATRDNAITRLTNNWIAADPQAASTWITTLDPGPERDTAIQALLKNEGAYNLPSAINWAKSISDPRTRTGNLQSICYTWAFVDLPALEKAINEADIPEEGRATMLETVKGIKSRPKSQ